MSQRLKEPLGEGGGFSYAVQQCLVIAKGDDGEYYLATREVFEGRDAADKYAATVAPERKPLVVTAVKPISWNIRS